MKRIKLNNGGRPTTKQRGTFVCSGSMADDHAPLYFTPKQAGKGCPRGCGVTMIHKDSGQGA